MNLRRIVVLSIILFVSFGHTARADAQEKKQQRYLYVVAPGVRNYLEFGGAGILVFDMDNQHKFVKRIKTPASLEAKPINIKGVCACAATKRLYFSTLTNPYCVDLLDDE